jgi:hypothetical protein
MLSADREGATMMTCITRAVHRRLNRREVGAATLETVGMYAVAAVLAVAVMLVLASANPVIGGRLRQALCMVTTLGQGSCEASTTSAFDHKPADPCVVTAKGHTGAVEGGIVLTLGANEKLLIEKLNNGQSRVTRGVGGTGGVTGGVGANVSGTWNDKTVGLAASADVGAGVTFSGGEVYYANTQKDVDNLVAAHREDVTKSVVLSGQLAPLGSLVDFAKELTGIGSTFPPPDEVYVAGNASASVAGQLTLGPADAQAGGSTQSLLGTRLGNDGSSTTYYETSLAGKLTAGTWAGDEQTNQTVYSKAGLEGKKVQIIEVERDSKGIITGVRAKSVVDTTTGVSEKGGDVNDGPGEKKTYTETVTELPILTPLDQATASDYLNAVGLAPMLGFRDLPTDVSNYQPAGNPLDALSPTKEFAQAARERGYVTRQTFDNGESGSYNLKFGVKALAEIGGGVTVDRVRRTAISAEYQNGSAWVPWKGCGSP